MKKLAAFLMAGVLFLGTAFGYHQYNKSHLDFNNNAFSTWSEDVKSLSRQVSGQIWMKIHWLSSVPLNFSMEKICPVTPISFSVTQI